MHDKFLVAVKGDEARRVVMGSANYTTEGLTQQANLMHTWEYPELATLYLKRKWEQPVLFEFVRTEVHSVSDAHPAVSKQEDKASNAAPVLDTVNRHFFLVLVGS